MGILHIVLQLNLEQKIQEQQEFFHNLGCDHLFYLTDPGVIGESLPHRPFLGDSF
uniref:Uncharacterized protein n=1 Tax=Arundo donax TaxID=35708 RepID=A0A0A9A7D9_ARUDO